MALSDTPASKHGKLPSIWLYLLILAWLVLSAFGFWWFEYRYWGAYPNQVIQFNPQAIQPLYSILKDTTIHTPLVVHFSDESCPCEAYRKAHVEKIRPMLGDTHERTITRQSAIGQTLFLAASPALAIWDEAGQLAYFGPYSSGLTCGAGLDFIAMVLKKLKVGDNPQWINGQGFGCFCSWQED